MRPADDLMRPLATCAPRLAATLGLAVIAAAGLPGEAAGQQRPESFTLPEPGPPPTPTPQGPVDIREGVVIGPRAIEEPAPPARPEPAPAQTPPAAEPVADPVANPAPSPSPSARPPATPPDAPPSASREAPPASGPAATDNEEASAVGRSDDDGSPAPEAAAIPPGGESEPAPAPPPASATDAGAKLELRVHRPGLLDLLRAYEGWILAGLALLVALLLIFWLAERRRRAAPARLAPPAPDPSPAASPPPDLAPQPPRIDARLDVVSATRSVMTLTLDLRLTLANRSDRAVRGLVVAAKLDCARPGEDAAAAIGAGEPLGEIARIGPQQGATVTAQLRLPVAELRLIRQGSGRVYIPLVHVTFEGEGVPATLRTFVIGTPSAGGAGRLHPLPVGAQVGAIHGLAAQAVNIPDAPAAPPRTAPEPA